MGQGEKKEGYVWKKKIRKRDKGRERFWDELLILLFFACCFIYASFISARSRRLQHTKRSRGAQSTLLTRLIYCLCEHVWACVHMCARVKREMVSCSDKESVLAPPERMSSVLKQWGIYCALIKLKFADSSSSTSIVTRQQVMCQTSLDSACWVYFWFSRACSQSLPEIGLCKRQLKSQVRCRRRRCQFFSVGSRLS